MSDSERIWHWLNDWVTATGLSKLLCMDRGDVIAEIGTLMERGQVRAQLREDGVWYRRVEQVFP